MPETITVETFSFAELLASDNDRAIERARTHLQDIARSDDWYDCVIECWKEQLAEYGFLDAEINFSGFWSQGDGASFTTRQVDNEKLLLTLLRRNNPCPLLRRAYRHHELFFVHVDRLSHHYSHERTCDLTVEGDPWAPEDLCERYQECGEAFRLALCRDIYRALEDEYEYLGSDDHLLSVFDEDSGSRFHADGSPV